MHTRNPEAQTLTDIMLAIFRINGRLLARGDVLTAPLAMTSARWQALGAIALAATPPSVPQIADAMGMTRQGAQKQINLLEADGLVGPLPNPRHKRSPLYGLTPTGRATFEAIDTLHTAWANALADGLDRSQLTATLDCLHALDARLGIIEPHKG